jgi:hypothetical protein
MEKNKKDFCTEIVSIGYIYDLYKRNRIIFIQKRNRKKWNTKTKKKLHKLSKKNCPVKPLICF